MLTLHGMRIGSSVESMPLSCGERPHWVAYRSCSGKLKAPSYVLGIAERVAAKHRRLNFAPDLLRIPMVKLLDFASRSTQLINIPRDGSGRVAIGALRLRLRYR